MGILIALLLSLFSFLYLLVALRSKRIRIKEDFFPPVSVISWFWKDGNIVERKIKNFLALEYPGKFEIIIIDNSSKDETQKMCEKYAKRGLIKYYRTPKEYDRKAVALDYAIKNIAKYDILAMTDPDGVCKKDWLEKIVEPFKDKKVGAVIGLTHAGNFGKNLFSKLRAIEDEWYFVISVLGRESDKDVNLVCGANYAVRRTALKSVNYHGKKSLGEDFELTIKLHDKRWKVKVADADVWEEEVETLGEYYRQRLRWQDSGLEVLYHYSNNILRIMENKLAGFFMFVAMYLINFMSLVYLIMMLFGFFYSFYYFIFGLLGWLVLVVSIAVGLHKFKRNYLIKYVPLYLLVEPFLAAFIQLLVIFLKLFGMKITWRSLHDGYYHAGTKIVMR
jgi:cellulose synthase/poly-beta-1,6-N-acetylglucosamine synthase-like glycosyltransferase